MTEVLLGREGLAGGLSRHDLQRWYRQMYRGVYVPKYATPSMRDRALGAWLYTDRAGVIGGVAASALHGAQWVDDDVAIEVLVGERRRQPGLIVRMDRVGDDEVTTVGGLPVTSVARTAFDIGRYQKRTTALARLDALMRVAPICSESVELIMKHYGPVRGVRQLRELLPLIDAGAASPKESWLRLLLIDGGLPRPETQIPVFDDGVPIAYLDMGYRDLKLAFEYDGDQHRSDRRQYVRDIRRLPMLERLGWEVIRVIAEDRPAEVLSRAKEAYLRRGGAEIDEMTRSTRTFAA
ncbi:hypothetical protein Y900_011550 [Mycolicibacterium aromaticivorans JS19b1 = JCM 16368]|uniref:Uncharacterized protein n=1 Tax=Mycolicibacterium aromaticivorans JS19b1 = JCM 16368 TaxID=1440774 RepID=A0A064CLG1_9MYCO|nr:type IV toxin-antitoxin system AbiEi family antitoxin [Mycolicibacterium aromaticivorans]KDE99558.1 hypothetical protein Y900_011550 [Mycolicibacterium aromaticivorans JS19b1 = JCM 16368]